MNSDPYLFVIRAGPVWSLEKNLLFLARGLGLHFDGEIVTWGARHEQLESGRFKVTGYAWDLRRPFISRLLFTWRVLMRGLKLVWGSARPVVVITYDPFQSGLIAVMIKALTGARFICEVNGIYWHPDTFADIKDPRRAEARRRRMVKVGSFVLRRADALKLLFPEQVEGFPPGGLPRTRASFPDLINENLFVPRGIDPERKILFVGQPFFLKGVDLLLQAFADLRSRYPDWTLQLVGFRLSMPASGLGIPLDGVEILDPQDPEGIRDLMERAAVVVLPSRSEGMGRVLQEAALLGRARIGSRVGGIPSVIEDGVDGLLFAKNDAADLSRVLAQILDSERLRRTLGERARERALREFSVEAYVDNYRALVRTVCAKTARE